MRYADLLLAVLVLPFAASCSWPRATVLADPEYQAERGRSYVTVVAAPRDPGLVAPAEEARQLVASALRGRWFNVLDLDALVALDPALAPLLRRGALEILAGRPVEPAIVERLGRLHGIGQLLVVDVYRYDQYWGRETKLTRVGVEARLVHLGTGRRLWEGRHDPEVTGTPGKGYDTATRRAAEELVRLLANELPRFQDLPVASWPVVDDLAPN
jgi:hypothetical protein